MTIPTYLPYFVLVSASAIIATILFGLRNALAQAAWPKHDRAVAFRISAVSLVGWFLLALALGLAGAYKAAPDRLPTIQGCGTASMIRPRAGDRQINHAPIRNGMNMPYWIVGMRSGPPL